MKDERTYGGEQTIWKHGVKYYIVCIPIIIGELISIIPISIDKYTERKYNATEPSTFKEFFLINGEGTDCITWHKPCDFLQEDGSVFPVAFEIYERLKEEYHFRSDR